MKWVASFTYDDNHSEIDDGEWIVKRERFDWLIEALEEYMPTRNNSELHFAVRVNDEGKEFDVYQKVLTTLKARHKEVLCTH